MLRVLPHRILQQSRYLPHFRPYYFHIAKMATTAPENKAPIPPGTSASGRMVPAQAAGKKAKETANTPSYPLEVLHPI